MRTQLVDPFPMPWARPRLWVWMTQAPQWTFDDEGPQTPAALEADLAQRLADGERLWGVTADGVPCGAIGYRPISHRTGMFHGIVFDRVVHGTGVAQDAARQVLEAIWATGVAKVSASFFADNRRVHRFLQGLGAEDEGLLRAQTTRGGEPIDMRVVAMFAPTVWGV